MITVLQGHNIKVLISKGGILIFVWNTMQIYSTWLRILTSLRSLVVNVTADLSALLFVV